MLEQLATMNFGGSISAKMVLDLLDCNCRLGPIVWLHDLLWLDTLIAMEFVYRPTMGDSRSEDAIQLFETLNMALSDFGSPLAW